MKILKWFKKDREPAVAYRPRKKDEPYEDPSYLLTSFESSGNIVDIEFFEIIRDKKKTFKASTERKEGFIYIDRIYIYSDKTINVNGCTIQIDDEDLFSIADRGIYEFKITSCGYKLLSLDQYNKIKSYIEENIDLKEQVKITVEEWGYEHIESSRRTVGFDIPANSDGMKIRIWSSLREEGITYAKGGRSKDLRYPYEMKDSKIIMDRIAPLLTELGYGSEAMNRDIDEIIKGL